VLEQLPTVAKAIAAAVTAFGGALGTALADGTVTAAEWIGIAVTTVVATGAVGSTPNADGRHAVGRGQDTGGAGVLLLAAAAVVLLVAASAGPALAHGRPTRPPRPSPTSPLQLVPEILYGITACGSDARTQLTVRVLRPDGPTWVVDPDGPGLLTAEAWTDGRWTTPPQGHAIRSSLVAGAGAWRWRPYLVDHGQRTVTGPEYRLPGDTCSEGIPALISAPKAAA
jgi:hypothetical protein